ncbi:MAG: hypothetical protein ACLT98_14490, partial [Eggerthellaceae bacterium]
TPTLPSNVVFLAKAAAVVLLVVSLVGFARIGLMSATISTTMQSSQLTSQISDARSSGAALEVSQSTLSNPTKVKQQAGKLGMAAPETTGVITLDKDVVATDESGALSLSKRCHSGWLRGVKPMSDRPHTPRGGALLAVAEAPVVRTPSRPPRGASGARLPPGWWRSISTELNWCSFPFSPSPSSRAVALRLAVRVR